MTNEHLYPWWSTQSLKHQELKHLWSRAWDEEHRCCLEWTWRCYLAIQMWACNNISISWEWLEITHSDPLNQNLHFNKTSCDSHHTSVWEVLARNDLEYDHEDPGARGHSRSGSGIQCYASLPPYTAFHGFPFEGSTDQMLNNLSLFPSIKLTQSEHS